MAVSRTIDDVRITHLEPHRDHRISFPVRSLHVCAVSDHWDEADELGCRWDDSETGLDWPTSDPLVSERDAAAARRDPAAPSG